MGNIKSSLKKKKNLSSASIISERNHHNEESSINLTEVDRQQEVYYHYKLMFNGNCSAPVHEYLRNGCKVLDIGCGSGIWICELATEFPKSTFIGVDMVPVYPSEIKPNNAEFVKNNILKGLTFKDNEFDYVHSSKMGTVFKDEEWINKVIPELIRVTKPQGWIEFSDVDIRLIDAGPNSTRLVDGISQGMSNSGINTGSITLVKKWLQPRVTNITELNKLVPIGVWEPTFGNFNLQDCVDFVKLQRSWLANAMDITEDKLLKLEELAYAEFYSTKYKGKFSITRVFGQKI
ncbi:hypothetical protein Glove_115g26 [Diversispora epigaea]|uniref:Methyltransferase domain-containing protein n=1 Tax=Diversispora epigaea TaxID=1348612 RepID=A0A397J0Y7_9GLOM|nr:hypothetical protein Glove_115g26 [Diversispora epigaea]